MMHSKWVSLVAVLAIALTAGQATLAPRPAHALAAVLTGGTAVPALVLLGAGAVAMPLGGYVLTSPPPEIEGLYIFIGGLFSAFIGLVMLDESGTPTPDFRAISFEEARTLEITSGERNAFNRQLDRINATSESIARELAGRGFKNARKAIDFARSEWSAAHERGEIGDAAYTALIRRGAAALNQVRLVQP